MSRMSRTAIVLLAGGLLCSLPGSRASADSACDKPHNDFDGLYCLNKVYQQSDADLNNSFSLLRGKLDPSGRSALRSSQIAWLQTRNDSCSKHEDGGFLVNLSCASKMTIERTQFLQDRYRECVSSGCMNSRIR